MGIAIGFCMRESLLLVLAARARQLQRRPVHSQAHDAEEELLDRIRHEGLAIVAADVELDPHELLVSLLRRALD